MTKERRKFIIVCNIVAAIGTGLAACGFFYTGEMVIGGLFLACAVTQTALALINYNNGKQDIE